MNHYFTANVWTQIISGEFLGSQLWSSRMDKVKCETFLEIDLPIFWDKFLLLYTKSMIPIWWFSSISQMLCATRKSEAKWLTLITKVSWHRFLFTRRLLKSRDKIHDNSEMVLVTRLFTGIDNIWEISDIFQISRPLIQRHCWFRDPPNICNLNANCNAV